jgi:Rrf2 family protein
MRFNKTTRYAFRIFAFMSMNRTKVYRADEMYEHLKIPLRYLRRLLTDLSKTGLMESIQGNRGGFRLKIDSEEITLFDIFSATELNQEKNLCFFGYQECQFGKNKCHMHDHWITIIEGIEKLLKTTTLADLTDNETQKFITDKIQLLTKNK